MNDMAPAASSVPGAPPNPEELAPAVPALGEETGTAAAETPIAGPSERDDTAQLLTEKKHRSIAKGDPAIARRRMFRTAQIIAFFALLNYVVLPQLNGLRAVIEKLSEVNSALLVLGLAFEIGALISYSQLTRIALSPNELSLWTLFRIQLATKAVTNLVPGGSAAGSALGYRLLTLAKVEPTNAGLALATSGLGSAVVLNLLLWATLLVSIPLSGLNPVYVSTALVGLLLMGAFFGLIVATIKGVDRAEQTLFRLSAQFSFLNPERASTMLRRIANRISELTSDRSLLRKLLLWSVLNWVLDAIALWVFLRAFGVSVRPDSLLVAFCVANVLAAVPLTPGGLGVLDITLTSMLAFFGVGTVAALGVPAYRLSSYWLPIPLGAAAYFTLRVGRFRIDRKHVLASLRDEAGQVVATGESVYDWADRITVGRVSAAANAAKESGEVIILADRAQPGTVRLGHQVKPPDRAPQPAPPPLPDDVP